ncbi:hypothetical protein [Priestia koreensis]|uniref:hypothetical protein n=1 Tax=Priestia koreensis TaxID=284581 RepID=UPI003015FEC3
MSEGVSVAIFAIFLWALAMFSPEFAAHATRAVQANELKEYAIQQTAKYGGYTSEVQAKIEKRMKEFNMSPSDWEVIHPANAVNMDQTFEIEVRGIYEYRVFNLLGTGVGHKDVPVKAVGSGLGQVLYR